MKFGLKSLLSLSVLVACQKTEPFKTQTVEPQPFAIHLELPAEAEPESQVFLAPQITSKVTFLAEEGKSVQKGELMARLDTESLEDDLTELELSLVGAKNNLKEMQKTGQATRLRFQTLHQQNQQALALKSLRLKTLKQGIQPKEQERLEAQLSYQRKALEVYRKEYQEYQALEKKGVTSKVETLQAQKRLTASEEAWALIHTELKEKQKGASPYVLQIAEKEYQQAQKELSIVQKQAQLQKRITALELDKIRITIQSLEQKLKQAQKDIQAAQLKAPLEGSLILNKVWSNTGLKQIKVGDEVQKGRPFLSVANLEQIVVHSELPEEWLSQIKIGQKVTLKLPTQGAQRVPAQITSLGMMAHTPRYQGEKQDVGKVFDLYAKPDIPLQNIHPGATLSLELTLKAQKAALIVPPEAIIRKANHSWVRLKNGQEKKVELGDQNAEGIVVLKGLSPGDQIVIQGASP